LIGEDGRPPEPPDPAYQQILKGIPAADFSAVELLYLPRNVRAHRLYGMSPVEQIALTVNIALRRDASTLDYYRAGSSPDAFATLPREWTADQIRSFQDYFDALMSGNVARRRQTKFMPADFKLIEARQPPLKDQYDEWLARIICYAFSVPASAFVAQVNRATWEMLLHLQMRPSRKRRPKRFRGS
jgi:phage portal protein BeeE